VQDIVFVPDATVKRGNDSLLRVALRPTDERPWKSRLPPRKPP